MKKSTLLIALALTGSMFMAQDLQARGRQNGNGGNHGSASATIGRPGNMGQGNHSGNSGINSRPGGNGNHNFNNGSINTKPGNAGITNNRPGNNGNHNGNNNNNGYRPGNNGNHNGNNNGYRPGNNGNHNGNNNGYRPGNNPGYRPGHSVVPPRPHTPPHFHYYRPTPPPAWRPSGRVPSFASILGLTLGSAIANSFNMLINAGYIVDGYTNNAIYLSNVQMYNVYWPEATMFYNNGLLAGSAFTYASAVPDAGRYNYMFNVLTSEYGRPVSSQSLSNGGYSSTWWGYNGNYITLAYSPQYDSNGYFRYFTTLSMGR